MARLYRFVHRHAGMHHRVVDHHLRIVPVYERCHAYVQRRPETVTCAGRVEHLPQGHTESTCEPADDAAPHEMTGHSLPIPSSGVFHLEPPSGRWLSP